ncbi:MAG: OmpH family outer membrane protein [Bacteroidota bacterium]
MTKRMRIGIFSFLVAAVVALPVISGTAQAQSQMLKVGYTDHEIIIVNMPEYQQVQNQLQQQFRSGQEEMQSLYQDYQDRLDRYQRQQALLSEERRAEREQELMELQQEIQQAAAQKEEEIAEREAELMAPLFQRVQSSIDTVARRQGLDLVLRANAGNQPLILFVNQDTVTDITMDVARDLGIKVDETDVN